MRRAVHLLTFMTLLAWKTNPSGLYADWNPQVNCNNTTDIQSMDAH
jgi:hypothetical protein